MRPINNIITSTHFVSFFPKTCTKRPVSLHFAKVVFIVVVVDNLVSAKVLRFNSPPLPVVIPVFLLNQLGSVVVPPFQPIRKLVPPKCLPLWQSHQERIVPSCLKSKPLPLLTTLLGPSLSHPKSVEIELKSIEELCAVQKNCFQRGLTESFDSIHENESLVNCTIYHPNDIEPCP